MNDKNLGNLITGVSALPALSIGADILMNEPITSTMQRVVGLTDAVLHFGNSYLNPLLAKNNALSLLSHFPVSSYLAGGSVFLLSNSILKNFDYMRDHKKLRLLVNAIAAGVTFVGGTAAAPYVVAGSMAYGLGKPLYNFTKGALNRTTGATVGFFTGAFKGAYDGAKNGIRRTKTS